MTSPNRAPSLSDAIRKGDAATVQARINAGEKPTDADIMEAESCDFPEVCKILIEAKFLDINEDLDSAGDMLITAVWEQKSDFVAWLLAHGAKPNSNHRMADSINALTAAAEIGSLPLAQMLLDYEANVNGTGALPGAAGTGKLRMVIFLLDKGADINEIGVHDYGDRRKRKEEGTALHKAAERGDLEMAKYLVNKGADLSIRDLLGKTPLDRANQAGQTDMVKYLQGLTQVTAVS